MSFGGFGGCAAAAFDPSILLHAARSHNIIPVSTPHSSLHRHGDESPPPYYLYCYRRGGNCFPISGMYSYHSYSWPSTRT